MGISRVPRTGTNLSRHRNDITAGSKLHRFPGSANHQRGVAISGSSAAPIFSSTGNAASRLAFDVSQLRCRKVQKVVDIPVTQQYCCVMIPDAVDINGIWNVLPPGVHEATLDEVEKRFATTGNRRNLFGGFRRGVESLRNAGCKVIFLDGGFVTEKTRPNDFDACWDPTGVDTKKLDPTLLDFTHMRKKQKDKYGGEFFPSSARADGMRTFAEFFQTDRHTGQRKGIIKIKLS